MSRPRIPFPEPDAMSPRQREVLDAIAAGPRGKPVGPLLMALHNPELADRWQSFGEILRYRTCLPPHLSELAILVTARRWNSEMEWVVHAAAARAGGLSAEVIEAIRMCRQPSFASGGEAEIYRFVAELQMHGRVSDEAYAVVLARWGNVGVVELTALVGYYTLVSMTLNAHHILPASISPDLVRPGEPVPQTLTKLPLGTKK